MIRIVLTLAVVLGASWALAADPDRQEANKQDTNKRVVLDFYDKGLNQRDFEAAAVHFGPRYIQHNPIAADGIDGFKAYLAFLRQRFPNARSEIKKVFADGDYVILHVHAVREPGTPGSAIVDIFRLEDGKIVEHWDVNQPVPEKMAHGNGMF